MAYEEVVEINPQLSHPRPIVLVGKSTFFVFCFFFFFFKKKNAISKLSIAPKCGPFDLTKVKYNLVTGDPNRFSGAVPRMST